ncbi:MAG TPA: hypothetical protein VNW92_03865 [Polyangiaceae bacterium]|jgi:hypothetical protein|nr:hypothetical protein [Polyangiaceae bacterium]
MTTRERLTRDERLLRALHFLTRGAQNAPSEAFSASEPDGDDEPPSVDDPGDWDALVRGRLPRL